LLKNFNETNRKNKTGFLIFPLLQLFRYFNCSATSTVPLLQLFRFLTGAARLDRGYFKGAQFYDQGPAMAEFESKSSHSDFSAS